MDKQGVTHHEQFPLSSASQSSVSLLIRRREFSSLIFQLLKLLKFWHTARRDKHIIGRVQSQ